MKLCPKCREIKPANSFSKNAGRRDGLQGYCKVCSAVVVAKYKAANREKIRVAYAKYSADNREQIKARRDKYRAENAEKVKASRRASEVKRRSKYPDRVRAQQLKYYKVNADKCREKSRSWAKRNQERRRIVQQNRLARKRINGGELSKDIVARLYELQRGRCACCKRPLGDNCHLDHIMPIALGGAHTDDNVQLLRAECNVKKGAKHPVEFMQRKGFLL